MFMGIAVGPIVALIAGILILFIPRLLNYIVALYLIIVGILGLVGAFMRASCCLARHSGSPKRGEPGISK